jgi:hypothetical protein
MTATARNAAATDSQTQHLAEIRVFLADAGICRDSFPLIVHACVQLAAAGHGAEVLAMIAQSPEVLFLSPLAGGIRLHLGQPDATVGRSHELAREINARILTAQHHARPSVADRSA